ncbi:MAG TPA: class I SAM-dependent methyltransferase [Balneolales bacterium]|nr:class I SAM-dependent methyltransferase [Balneolales bacterium]
MENWKTQDLASIYIEGVRGAIPLPNAQIEILLRIIRSFKPELTSFLDLGCGDGFLGCTLYSHWPDSKGLFVDYSEPMIEAAKSKCESYQNQSRFFVQDFGKADWIHHIAQDFPVDVVISGFSIHHQNNDSKKRLYREIFSKILKPGGIFLDLDQVSSASQDMENVFDDYFLDHVKQFQEKTKANISIDKISEEYYKDKQNNKLASVKDQCEWLRNIGFTHVDCFFKAFELSIFGGLKPG